jgi:hypothetical protein
VTAPRPFPRGLLAALLLMGGMTPLGAEAGPLVRRLEERRACQEFAGKLQAASGNPQQQQAIYQQGVLKLVEKFGENPCGDIPAPAAVAPAVTAPAATAPATPAAPAKPPAAPAAPTNPQQAQACQEFASKLQSAQGNPAQAQQIYAMGSQKLSGMFGPNPCPQIQAP